MSRRAATVAALLALVLAGCWRLGEPTGSPAVVTWAAFPDTVRAGETFSFEFAGPVSRDACTRLDTAYVTVSGGGVEITARRSSYETLCPDDRVSFYEAPPLRIERPGRYPVRASGREFGTLVVVEEGEFSPVTARGEGTLRRAGGCLFFGPGWANNQRPFALQGDTRGLDRWAGTDTVVWVRGRLSGFAMCGPYGSRPRILVEEARATDRAGEDYYEAPS